MILAINGGFFDGAISKFSADGSQLLWSAYLGGYNLDQPHSMDCDENGNLYVMGLTGSSDFAVTANANDTTFGGGNSAVAEYYTLANGSDMYVSAISADGTQLLGSTFLGVELTRVLTTVCALIMAIVSAERLRLAQWRESLYSSHGRFFRVSNNSWRYRLPRRIGRRTFCIQQKHGLAILQYLCGHFWRRCIYTIALTSKGWQCSQLFLITISLQVRLILTESYLSAVGDSLVLTSSGNHSALLGAIDLRDYSGPILEAIHSSTDTAYNQHFFIEPNSPGDTTTVFTVVGQHKGGLLASDTNFWGQPGSAQYFHGIHL